MILNNIGNKTSLVIKQEIILFNFSFKCSSHIKEKVSLKASNYLKSANSFNKERVGLESWGTGAS